MSGSSGSPWLRLGGCDDVPYDFTKARSGRAEGLPSSAEARLHRALFDLVTAEKSGRAASVEEAMAAAETVLADYAKG